MSQMYEDATPVTLPNTTGTDGKLVVRGGRWIQSVEPFTVRSCSGISDAEA